MPTVLSSIKATSNLPTVAYTGLYLLKKTAMYVNSTLLTLDDRCQRDM